MYEIYERWFVMQLLDIYLYIGLELFLNVRELSMSWKLDSSDGRDVGMFQLF